MYLKVVADSSPMIREDATPVEAAKRCMVDASIQVATKLGYSDAAGALRGVLMLADKPRSMDYLVEQTGYSKSTVSTNMAHLERMGIVRRVRLPGDKRYYYSTIISIDEGTKVHNENFRQIMQIIAAGAAKAQEILEGGEEGDDARWLRSRLALVREECSKALTLADLLDRFTITELIDILKLEVEGRKKGGK